MIQRFPLSHISTARPLSRAELGNERIVKEMGRSQCPTSTELSWNSPIKLLLPWGVGAGLWRAWRRSASHWEKISQSLGRRSTGMTAAFSSCTPMAEEPPAQGDERPAGGALQRGVSSSSRKKATQPLPRASPSLPQASAPPCPFSLLFPLRPATSRRVARVSAALSGAEVDDNAC